MYISPKKSDSIHDKNSAHIAMVIEQEKAVSEPYRAADANSEVWERTADIRVARNPSHVGRPERLQQRWWSLRDGRSEWRDVPTVDVTD